MPPAPLLQTSPTSEEIQQVTREILSRPEFQPEPPWAGWGQALVDWMAAVLHDIILWLREHPVAQWMVWAVLGLLLLLMSASLVSRLLAALAPGWGAKHLRRSPRAAAAQILERATPWGDALQRVRHALQQGDGYHAIWILHRLFVDLLDHRGLLTFASWKTNADYLRECPRHSAFYATLFDLTRAYDQIVYAHRTVPLQTLSELVSRVEHAQHHQQ